MLPCTYACGSADHTVSRRSFLGTSLGATTALGLAGFANPAAAKELSALTNHEAYAGEVLRCGS